MVENRNRGRGQRVTRNNLYEPLPQKPQPFLNRIRKFDIAGGTIPRSTAIAFIQISLTELRKFAAGAGSEFLAGE